MVPLLQNNVDLDAPPMTNNNGNQHPSSSLFFPTATMSSDGAKNQQCCPSILPFPVRREQRASGGGAMQQNHGSGGLDSFFGLLLFLAATRKWCAGRSLIQVNFFSTSDMILSSMETLRSHYHIRSTYIEDLHHKTYLLPNFVEIDINIHLQLMNVEWVLQSFNPFTYGLIDIVEESSDVVHNSKSSTRCSKDKRNIIFETLLKHSVNGKVKYGLVKDVASMYSVSTRTVSRIWKKGIACVTNGVPVDISLNLSGNVGRKRIQINPEDVARIPLNRRTTIRSLARALDM
nr:Transposase, Tc1-like protein [Ipomoea batatas]